MRSAKFAACSIWLALSVCETPSALANSSKSINAPTLFSLLDSAVRIPPKSRADVENLLGIKLGLSRTNINGVEFFSADNVRIGDVTAEIVDYAQAGDTQHKALDLELEITGCVPRKAILAHYIGLQIISSPRHSPAEEFVYSRSESWGQLHFGFQQYRAECLRRVEFRFH